MAFDNQAFAAIIGGHGSLIALWNYSTADTAAAVLGSGYFDPAHESFKVGDLIFAVCSVNGVSERLLLTVTDVTGGNVTVDAIAAANSSVLSGSEIKSAYEAEADTNAFTDADKNKLDNLTSGTGGVFGTSAGTYCEGNDDRIPNPDEQSFLAMVTKSGDNFTITSPGSGTITLHTDQLDVTDGVNTYRITPTSAGTI